jgi:geranylgeranyl pyrophosphate synthase
MNPGERTIAEDLMATVNPTDAQIHEVIAIVEERGGIEAARARAGQFAREAEAELDQIPASRARDALCDAVSYVVERRS